MFDVKNFVTVQEFEKIRVHHSVKKSSSLDKERNREEGEVVERLMNGETAHIHKAPAQKCRWNQRLVLNRFIIARFVKGALDKYGQLFETDTELEATATKFMEILLRRARSTTLQFKTICCIVVKFLEVSSQGDPRGTNYMRFLRYSILKLIAAAFVLSVPNRQGDFGDRLVKRDHCYAFYSRITGLSLDEVTNCSSIVRLVLIHQMRYQQRLRRHQDISKWGIFRESTNQGDCCIEGEYILGTEIEQFNRLGSKLVQQYFNIV